ncbi:thiamine pyrophosphate-binding protein [Thermodesulfobacteriota bacterium]
MKVSQVIATYLKSRNVSRVYGLCGGHIQPLWDEIARQGLQIVDVRDEKAAVHMAQAQAELTGETGVALVTAGPGFTNAITGIANAFVSRVPVLVITGSPPLPQRGKGALQEVDQINIVGPVTRYAQMVTSPQDALTHLEKAFVVANGHSGESGPVVVDFPTDVLRATIHIPTGCFNPVQKEQTDKNDCAPENIRAATELIWSAKHPVVITGRGAVNAGHELVALLDVLGCAYLDTAESRGLIPGSHPSFMPSMRGRLMSEADLIITLGRSLDFQLAYGSPAVFKNAKFVRIGTSDAEVRKNRPGDTEIFGPVGEALKAIVKLAGSRKPAVDPEWIGALQNEDRKRREAFEQRLRETPHGKDGAMHPYRLLGEIKRNLTRDAIVVADGGDILSFARQAFSERTYLDSGPFGCLGVGTPYGISAALAFPDRQVIVVTGDGAFGFNAMELDTCRRMSAKVVFVVANNAAWNIERQDQLINYDEHLVGVDLENCDYAALARSMGLHAQHVSDPDLLSDALAKAFDRAPALLDVTVTRDAASPDFLSGIAAVPDLQALSRWDEMERKKDKE